MAAHNQIQEVFRRAGRFVGKLNPQARAAINRTRYGQQIRSGTFTTPEHEFASLGTLIKPGDWVLDIGANVGHYTARMSDLVGTSGRVIAFEPVGMVFSLLSTNVEQLKHNNVTLLNVAVSETPSLVGMATPEYETGGANYFRSSITSDGEHSFSVLALPVDSISLPHRIALVKVDVENHEQSALVGMQKLIERDRPILILETESAELIADLEAKGYTADRMPGSPNVVLTPSLADGTPLHE